MNRGSKRVWVDPVNPMYGDDNLAWVKASRRVFLHHENNSKTKPQTVGSWGQDLKSVAGEMGGRRLQNHGPTNTSWITDCPGPRPPPASPTVLLLLCDICMSVRLCCVFMFAFYEDSGLCGLSAVTHEEYFRHCCQLCLQTPVSL